MISQCHRNVKSVSKTNICCTWFCLWFLLLFNILSLAGLTVIVAAAICCYCCCGWHVLWESWQRYRYKYYCILYRLTQPHELFFAFIFFFCIVTQRHISSYMAEPVMRFFLLCRWFIFFTNLDNNNTRIQNRWSFHWIHTASNIFINFFHYHYFNSVDFILSRCYPSPGGHQTYCWPHTIR